MSVKSNASIALVAAALTVLPMMSIADAIGSDVVTEKVNTSGLDLNTIGGAESLLKRLSIAAANACGMEAKFDPLRTDKFDHCYQRTLSNAIRTVNRPLVTQAFAVHYPQAAAVDRLDGGYASTK
jgi:UrcA family protein